MVDFGDPEKETLIRAELTGTVLLRGEQDKAREIRFTHRFAKGEALVIMGKPSEALASFRQAMSIEKISNEKRVECEKRIEALRVLTQDTRQTPKQKTKGTRDAKRNHTVDQKEPASS